MKKIYACLVVAVLAVTPSFAVLVARWDFADQTCDDQSGGLDGTANGSVLIVDSGTSYFKKAVQIGSVKGMDYLNLGDIGTLGIYTNSFTVSLWVYRDSGEATTEFWDSQNGSRSAGYDGFTGSVRANNISNANKVYVSVGGGGLPARELLKKSVVADGQWHWVVIRYDGEADELKYFEDGVHAYSEDAIAVCSLVREAGRDLYLGDGFGGQIGDVRIYDTALSFAEDESGYLSGGELFDIYSGSSRSR